MYGAAPVGGGRTPGATPSYGGARTPGGGWAPGSRTPGGGYATEKLVHSLLAGAVPVYWGDAVEADGDFFNFRRVIVYDGDSNESVISTVRQLENDANFRAEWLAQPLLSRNAQAWVSEWASAATQVVAAAVARKREMR